MMLDAVLNEAIPLFACGNAQNGIFLIILNNLDAFKDRMNDDAIEWFGKQRVAAASQNIMRKIKYIGFKDLPYIINCLNLKKTGTIYINAKGIICF